MDNDMTFMKTCITRVSTIRSARKLPFIFPHETLVNLTIVALPFYPKKLTTNNFSTLPLPTSPEPSLAFCPRETSVFPLRFPCDLPATASMSVTQSLSSIKADKRDLLPRPYLCFLVVGRKNTLEHYQDVAPLCPSDPLGRMQFWRPRRGRRAVLTPGGGE